MLCPEGVLSDSEEEKGPEAVAQQNTTSVWSNKPSAEQGGYSSEASSERGKSKQLCVIHHCIQPGGVNRNRQDFAKACVVEDER